MSFLRYPEYKASGVEWLGKVPEHWDVVQLRHLASMKSGESITSDSIHEAGDYPVYGGNGLRGYSTSFTHDGSHVLIGRQGALCGNVNYANGKFWASEHAVVVQPRRELEVRWLGELLRAMNLNQYSVSAAQPGLAVEAIAALRTALPPLGEQRAIAAFLDRETAKIDALVAEQERLIELLAEKRQAVISHAVTKGLDPTAPMKPSCIEWLGDVPAHWEVRRLGDMASKIGSGKTPSGGAEVYIDSGVIFLRSQNVLDGELWLEDVAYIPDSVDDELAGSRVQQGDILLNITGASLGRSCLVPHGLGRANVNQHVCIVRLEREVGRPFVSLAMRSQFMASQFELAQTGAAREGLNFFQISKLVVALPPEPEQAALVQIAEKTLNGIARLTRDAEQAIALLRERRSALISAAVTGQIDVRNAVPVEVA